MIEPNQINELKPLLCLDVDGVLIVQSEHPLPGYEPYPGRPYEYYSPNHGIWLESLLSYVEGCFITSHQVNLAVADLLKLPELPWLKPYVPVGGEKGILPEVAVDREYTARPTALVSDDNLPRLHGWANERNEQGIPTLIVGVETAAGLQKRHVSLLKGWLQHLGIAGV